ncbi:kinase-like domain-containing protein [Glomus cerebriforme]|uniref:Kinase-like domain-containing protein n=1 Tax=Glomus cerebriforme TaxID=658196 RepID=A0A397S6T2_9GLOM|nr:kinase-like domain-containing protein [Glomus cerebriforme]
MDDVNSGYKNVDDMIIASQNYAKNDTDYLEWIEFSRLKIWSLLDKGAFGRVYDGKWYKGYYSYTVAIKFFDNDKDFLKEFTNIYRMIKKCSNDNNNLSNKNIIHYYGATYDYDDEEYGIVMKYCPQNSLSNYLIIGWRRIYWDIKLKILRDIAYGLYILHNNDLIHGDLHSGNIMIDDSDDLNIAWIGDLGFCRDEEVWRKNCDINGVIAFTAPEIFKGLPYTKKADIYSFGVIMYHISTNRPPFYDKAHDNRLMKQISKGLKPTLYQDDEIPSRFENLMHHCLNFNPKNRPNAYTLYKKFHDWIENEEFEHMKWETIRPLDESEYHSEANYMSQIWS